MSEMTFNDCLATALKSEELVSEWDRLTGYRLRALGQRSPIDKMVDDATGFGGAKGSEIAGEFIAFVFDYLWFPLAGVSDE